MTTLVPDPLLQASDALTQALENAAHALRSLNLDMKEKAARDAAAALCDLGAAFLAIASIPDAPAGLPRPRALLISCKIHGASKGEGCDEQGGICPTRHKQAGEAQPAPHP